MDKYEYIVNLAEKTAKRVSQNRESWMKFLTSAARIYKYPFKEQLLIYAQNPDATACASIEIWNKRMNCWVNKGSSGIALPDDTATYGHKLKYVFDVSNVHAVKPNGRYPKAWKLREEHKSDVLHRLEQIYGSTDSKKPFEERIIEISDQLAADAYTELQIDYPDLQDRIGFDKLSEQDFALCLKKLISESVSFTILSACEIEISDHEFSFDYINQFVSIKTLSVLGTKINDSARGVLAEIGKTVRIYDKLREKEQEKEISKKELANAPQPRYNALKRESLQEGNSKDKDNIEGGKQNGPGIRTDGRLSDSETESKSGTGGNGNEIRTSEGQISEGEIRWGENSNVSGRNAESTSSRDSGTGKREDGSPDIPDGGERRSKRTAQSTGSDALGEEDEQHPEPGGGSRTERTDLQPTNFVKPEESYTQLSLFPSAEEQRGSITAAEASKKYTMPAAFYLPETDLEVIIRSGGGQKDSRKRIYAKYTEGKSTDEIIAFLKKEYSQVGKGFELHGHPISVWFDENGMTAGYGMQAAESVVTTLSWDQIEKYIHAMITYGLYMDANEAALVDKTEMERVSYQIGYFLRDWIDDVPEELNSIEKIETLLSTHEGREQLESFLEDVDARISYGELKPKTVKSPGYLLSEIADLDRERIHFPLHDTVDVRQEDFITQDEIDYALCIGSGFADVPWRPSDIEQQEGRILRQGNRNRKVKIFRYVTEGTFDAYSWQLIENKQKFISQIMTSKSPVRSCEDVDESALSYAEVKALATGNPYIKEKMDLDIQVSRLRLLKANYTSQKYRMEDNIVQHYPRQIVMVKELIEKLEQDIALYEQNAATSKDKFHMQVGSGVYDTRKDAGNAIIKFFQTDADGTAKIGTYLGFSMNIAFDSFNRKFVLRLKGAMNHPVEIGPDPVGNIIRLDNVLKTMPDKLAEAKDRLETLTNQLESAKIEVTKPFQQEEELAEKLKRLAELNALLNMDEKGTDALILEDDEQPAIVNSDMAVTPITSVKTKPMLKKKVVGLCL